MYSINIVMFITFMIVIPYILGYSISGKGEGYVGSWILENWNMGMLLMYGVFEILALIGTFAVVSLKRIGIVYIFLLSITAVIGMFLKWRKGQPKEKKMFKKLQLNWWEILLAVLVVAGVLYQMLYVSSNMHIDDDDAYYVGMAVTSYTTDTIGLYHPYTGMPTTLQVMAEYVLTPYPVYWALWSKIVDVPPAILMRTALPFINILWCYVVYYLLAKFLFQKFGQKMIFMLVVILANLFGAFSGFSSSVYLLTRIWQGKSVYASVFIPLFWYIWLKWRKEPRERESWKQMGIAVCASCLTSTMTLVISPILLSAFGLEYLLEKRDWKLVGKLVVCVLPLIGLAVCELYLKYWT